MTEGNDDTGADTGRGSKLAVPEVREAQNADILTVLKDDPSHEDAKADIALDESFSTSDAPGHTTGSSEPPHPPASTKKPSEKSWSSVSAPMRFGRTRDDPKGVITTIGARAKHRSSGQTLASKDLENAGSANMTSRPYTGINRKGFGPSHFSARFVDREGGYPDQLERANLNAPVRPQ